MMVDTTIYGYTFDGGAYHPECTDVRPSGDVGDVWGLYSSDDTDSHGLSCDGCSEYIFEPIEPHPWRDAPAGNRRDGRCWDCNEYADDEQLHPQPDALISREAPSIEIDWRSEIRASDARRRRHVLYVTCPECGRIFDLIDPVDADEWANGHDCEA